MSLKILFVENEPSMADVLVPCLERKGYQVTYARTQRQAISRTRSQQPDLLVLDVFSFGANGFKTAHAIRTRLDGVPAVLLVEKPLPGTPDQIEEFILPPFTSRKVLYRVKKLASRVANREIVIGPFSLDPDTRILCKGEDTCHLRPKEAALLALFFRNPGKILSRPEIIKQIWETDYVGDTRTLSVHVRWLRAKIEADPNHPIYLRTVRGVGYRFDVV
jgi:DNA-binding response OmpR family regulator